MSVAPNPQDCPNHPGNAGVSLCAGCGKAFCGRCTITLQGKMYCGACKLLVARGLSTGKPSFALADEALKIAIVGIFCLGIILEPIAIVKSVQALRAIHKEPALAGKGRAIAALVIGIVILTLNILWVGMSILVSRR